MMENVQKNWATVKRGEVFRGLSTTPENWSFSGRVKYQHGQCGLCSTELVWQYQLVERDTGRSLWVGSECVSWYYLSWMPNGLERALELLNKNTRALRKTLIAEKIEQFRVSHPDVVDYLLGPDRRGYQDRMLYCTIYGANEVLEDGVPVRVSKFRASIRRKGYLRDDELTSFLTGYNGAPRGFRYKETMERFNEANVTAN